MPDFMMKVPLKLHSLSREAFYHRVRHSSTNEMENIQTIYHNCFNSLVFISFLIYGKEQIIEIFC